MAYKFIPSPNYTRMKNKNNELIIIHWIVGTAKTCVSMMLRSGGVSAHYVVDRNGEITQMVDEKNAAYHAGVSSLPGYKSIKSSLNYNTIGIELEGPPNYVNGMEDWPSAQINATAKLCKEIASRYSGIKLTDHSTIAPKRKIDVKEKTNDIGKRKYGFPWEDLVKKAGVTEA